MSNCFAAAVNQTRFNGVDFFDIDPLLMNPTIRDVAMTYLKGKLLRLKPTHLLGVESRGFGLAAHLAQASGLPWAMARKAGKTPGDVLQKTFEAEYGPARTIELKKSLFKAGDRVVIVDDVLATGGTAAAMVELVHATGATVVACVFVAEIMALGGAAKYSDQIKTLSLIHVTPTCKWRETVFGELIQTPPVPVPGLMPVAPVSNTNKVVVMAHTSQHTVADELVASFPGHMERGNISWNYFPDGMPNISFESKLENRDVLFLGSLEERSRILEQLMMMRVLPRQGARSVTFYLPYFSMGTMERVDKEGDMASADPLASMLSNSIPRTKTGPVILFHDTIHALPERFFYGDGVRLKLGSHAIKPTANTAIVFPDEGAYKRFSGLYKGYPQIVCSKVRSGEERIVSIKETIGFGGPVQGRQAIIVDDLVQTGGTLYECYLLIKDIFTDVYASVTHAVFPDAAFLDFLPGGCKGGLKGFYITDSVPGTVEKIKQLRLEDFFIIKKLALDFCLNTYPELVDRSLTETVAVGSTNAGKVDAVVRSLGPHDKVIGLNVESGIPNQPYGLEEIEKGARNRARSAFELTVCDRAIGIESGLIFTGSCFQDLAVVASFDGRHFKLAYSDTTTIPECYTDLARSSLADSRSITFGKLLAMEHTNFSDDDWHKTLTGTSRYELISRALNPLSW